MNRQLDQKDVKRIAAKIAAEIRALPNLNAANGRVIRKKYSKMLSHVEPAFILDIGRVLINDYNYRWLAYELIQCHGDAFQSIGETELGKFGGGINSWWSVDSFARTLAGPAWLRGQVSDELIHKWARSKDRWWRRAALGAWCWNHW